MLIFCKYQNFYYFLIVSVNYCWLPINSVIVIQSMYLLTDVFIFHGDQIKYFQLLNKMIIKQFPLKILELVNTLYSYFFSPVGVWTTKSKLRVYICVYLVPRSIEHPKWDWRTKPENHDFDELNHILQESKKLGKALENLSRSKLIDFSFLM